MSKARVVRDSNFWVAQKKVLGLWVSIEGKKVKTEQEAQVQANTYLFKNRGK